MLASHVALVFTLAQANAPIRLEVDAREISRGVIHVRETIPALPGEVQLHFPQYIPGEHGPSGRLNGVVNVHFQAGGAEIPWTRDSLDVYKLRVTAPAGSSALTLNFDVYRGRGENSTNLARLNWHEVVYYRAGTPSDRQMIQAELRTPDGWKVSTALDVAAAKSGLASYPAATLTRLIDSPCLMGRYYRSYDLSGGDPVPQSLEVYGEAPSQIEFTDEQIRGVARMCREFKAQAGAQHFGKYRFLLSFSHAAGAGLEHNESSEDGMGSDTLAKEHGRTMLWYLLGHEGFHSWNGKFRRPAGLCTPDYNTPYRNELLWVYEGLTEFYGDVMPVRAGLWKPEVFRDMLALNAQRMQVTRGRRWRSLVDTTFVPLMPREGGDGGRWSYTLRGGDYYYEMTLIWLEADMRIRALTEGKRSLSDFCRIFHGGPNNGPEIKPYDLDEIVRTLGQIAPYDWAGLLRDRIYRVASEVPTQGFDLAGWRYVENDTPNVALDANNVWEEGTWLAGSIGLNLHNAEITDVIPDTAADRAGLVPGWKIVAVNGEKFSAEALLEAVKKGGKLTLIVERDRDVAEYTLEHAGGLKYPHLERIPGRPDRLADLLKPLSPI